MTCFICLNTLFECIFSCVKIPVHSMSMILLYVHACRQAFFLCMCLCVCLHSWIMECVCLACIWHWITDIHSFIASVFSFSHPLILFFYLSFCLFFLLTYFSLSHFQTKLYPTPSSVLKGQSQKKNQYFTSSSFHLYYSPLSSFLFLFGFFLNKNHPFFLFLSLLPNSSRNSDWRYFNI